jgi:disulfide bond formation protein DsbB
LCIVQRLCFMGVAAASLLAAIHHPTARGIIAYGALTSVPILGGIATAGRQVWLQHLPPDKVPECGPGLEFWLQTLPITETVQKIFRGTGECAEVDWTFLSLSIAEWSLACFAVMLVAVVAVIVAAAGQRARDMKFL